MVASGTTTFSDLADYRVSATTGATIDLVLMGGGDFRAQLTWVKLRRLHLFRLRENVPRIAFVTLPPKLVFVAFPTDRAPPTVWSGTELSRGDIVLRGIGERFHQRTNGASRWGLISLAANDLAAYGKTLVRLDLAPPPAGKILHAPASAAARLLRLHAQACRLAETKPDMIAHRGVARALEQDLLHALVNCLAAGQASDDGGARQRRAEIMARFEDVLAACNDQQLSTPKLCATIGVPERTLRACCAEFLGMSPGSYVRLRRLNLVRAALQNTDVTIASIAAIARRYGFSELGRFSAAYRTVFGEAPSATSRGVRPNLRDAISAEFA